MRLCFVLAGLAVAGLFPPAMAQTPATPPNHKPALAPAAAPAGKPAAPARKVPTVASPPAAKHPPSRGAAKPPAPAPAAAPVPPPALPAAPAPPAEPPKGTVTGMPLPRWASLRSDDVNMRVGPGTRYPIAWVYKRRDLPVQIEREFDVWRLVEDQDGVKGWVQQATLVGRRSLVVTGGDRTLRDNPQDTAGPVAVLKPGVIGHIRSCAAGSPWCEVQVGDYRGWLKRGDFWGTTGDEAVQ
ncbi:MAG: hypothetical protein JO326_06095 [Acetobacteraceae bacterium]|nr:hypothetical protein [Acetobacteraceae bacterium]